MSQDLESQVCSLLNQMITLAADRPSIVPHWVAIVDVRHEDGDSSIGVLHPDGMPSWMVDAMIQESGGSVYDSRMESMEEVDDEE